ncbi:hypothetical protein LOD99_5161 [Oopsacas minuta]|uniref:Uncharacterized protein n=1 Tax=Oopsacas minuta TaxID=111878 RepID=A0AAV7JRD7_9METZ|nr:hypothetical protein LOD99_5161 [Oopsacas minuta]
MISTVMRSVSRTSYRYLSSTPVYSPLRSHSQADIHQEEQTSPFYFGKTKHILGYTGLIPSFVPQLPPEAFHECLAVVKAGFEDRSLSPGHMINLVNACNSVVEIETFLDFVRKYHNTVFPQIPGLPLALIRTLIRLNSSELALDIFQHPEFALFPSSYPISILMDSLLKEQEFELALDAYELLEQVFSPITGQAIAIGAFAHVCEGSTALMMEARELLAKLKLSEWRFTHEAVKIAFIILNRQNRVSEANRLIEEFGDIKENCANL